MRGLRQVYMFSVSNMGVRIKDLYLFYQPVYSGRRTHTFDNVPSQLVVRRDETNCMWSTGNFIKGDFPPALVIALRINIFLASRMDGLQGSPLPNLPSPTPAPDSLFE